MVIERKFLFLTIRDIHTLSVVITLMDLPCVDNDKHWRDKSFWYFFKPELE